MRHPKNKSLPQNKSSHFASPHKNNSRLKYIPPKISFYSTSISSPYLITLFSFILYTIFSTHHTKNRPHIKQKSAHTLYETPTHYAKAPHIIRNYHTGYKTATHHTHIGTEYNISHKKNTKRLDALLGEQAWSHQFQ